MSRLGFYFDQTRCVGCRTCQMACKDVNDLDVGVLFREVKTYETGTYPNAFMYHYSGSCNHCENPACVANCPSGAMFVAEDGTVQHDDSLCLGKDCLICVTACPYGHPKFIETKGVTGKCSACKSLRDKGQNPACVDACIMRALRFGDLDDLEKEFGPGLTNELPILPSPEETPPSLLIKARESALTGEFREKEI
jgi:anaerobic dimethyl sulfoxide reductase subunit B (iron-sulfur subunit)